MYYEIQEHELISHEGRPLPPVPNYHTDTDNDEWREDRQDYLRPVERHDEHGYLKPVHSRHDAIPSKYLTKQKLPRVKTDPCSSPLVAERFRSTDGRHSSLF